MQTKKKTGKANKTNHIIDMKRHFTQEDMHMANKYMQRSSLSLAIREIQTKTTMR